MSRDFSKLRVFVEADALALEVYKTTAVLPPEERYGLQAQMRRAAVSVACNIVEGTARPSERDYVRFLHVARASARECGYLIDLSRRLGFLDSSVSSPIASRYIGLQAGLLKQIRALNTQGNSA